MSQENIEGVGCFTEAFNSGDVDRMETLFTDNAEIEGIRAALEETNYVGPGAVRRFWANAIETWSELRVDIEEIDARNDTVIARGIWHGRGRASGVDVEGQIGVRFHLEGGRIASLRTFIDPEQAG